MLKNIFKVFTMPSSKFSNLPSALPPSQRLIWVCLVLKVSMNMIVYVVLARLIVR